MTPSPISSIQIYNLFYQNPNREFFILTFAVGASAPFFLHRSLLRGLSELAQAFSAMRNMEDDVIFVIVC